MKIAITSTGNTEDAKIDKYFARCSYFVIFDSETKEYEFIENPSRTLQDNAGLAVVKLINDFGVKRIISGEFGLKVKAALDDMEIQMIVITDHNRSIKDLIELLRSNN